MEVYIRNFEDTFEQTLFILNPWCSQKITTGRNDGLIKAKMEELKCILFFLKLKCIFKKKRK